MNPHFSLDPGEWKMEMRSGDLVQVGDLKPGFDDTLDCFDDDLDSRKYKNDFEKDFEQC